MDVSLLSRLHRHRIHPIVLLVRFKSVKQIREVSCCRVWEDLFLAFIQFDAKLMKVGV